MELVNDLFSSIMSDGKVCLIVKAMFLFGYQRKEVEALAVS